MKTKLKMLNMLVGIGWLLLSGLLVGCGTFQVGVESSGGQVEPVVTVVGAAEGGEPVAMTPTMVAVSDSAPINLVSYMHPSWGYQLLIPNEARIDEEVNATYFMKQDDNGYMTLGVAVDVVTNLAERGVRSPEEFLRSITDSEINSFEVQGDDGKWQGAAVIVEEPGRFGSAVCATTRGQHAVFIVNEVAYFLSVMVDAPGRCDVTVLEETNRIINSFRLGVMESVTAELVPATPVFVMPTATPAFGEWATFTDETAGFALDYPIAWTADAPQVGGSRGYYANITSWDRWPGDSFDTVPTGETLLSVEVYSWEPHHDLEAYLAVRKQAWSGSGFETISEEEVLLAPDWRAVVLILQAPEEPLYFLVTPIGERYLVLSGSGDLETVKEIGQTLRMVN
ncbi:MAG TPA: hypothetical protein VLL52_12890 [Anaerolineae bacterium]|nr:hypothetical protein [Anaerolineae bacterium]